MSYVLLVEDNRDIREALSELLRLHGVEVVMAGDAREALALLHRTRLLPALIITDLSMAPGHGQELLAAISQEPWSMVPVFVVTASNERVSTRADLVFRKPLNASKLATLASAVVRRCQLAKAESRRPELS